MLMTFSAKAPSEAADIHWPSGKWRFITEESFYGKLKSRNITRILSKREVISEESSQCFNGKESFETFESKVILHCVLSGAQRLPFSSVAALQSSAR